MQRGGSTQGWVGGRKAGISSDWAELARWVLRVGRRTEEAGEVGSQIQTRSSYHCDASSLCDFHDDLCVTLC